MTTNPEQQQPTSRTEILVRENLRAAQEAGLLTTTLDEGEGPEVLATRELHATGETMTATNYSHRSAAQDRADSLKRTLRVAARVLQSGVFFFVTVEVPRYWCERCAKLVDEENLVDLELSVDDGCYYSPGEIPEGHESQGVFSFGRFCADKELARTVQEYEDPWGGRRDPSSMTDDELHEESIDLAEAALEAGAWDEKEAASHARRCAAIQDELEKREAALVSGDEKTSRRDAITNRRSMVMVSMQEASVAAMKALRAAEPERAYPYLRERVIDGRATSVDFGRADDCSPLPWGDGLEAAAKKLRDRSLATAAAGRELIIIRTDDAKAIAQALDELRVDLDAANTAKKEEQ